MPMLKRSGLQPDRTKPSLIASRAALTILLVDDDSLVRSAMRAVLSYAGYNVVACEDGPTAISLFALRPKIDVLLTDLQMPEMTGYVLAEALTDSTPGLPVVLVSGASREEIPLEGIESHQWHFIPKPVNRDVLLTTLDGLFATTHGQKFARRVS